MTSQFTRERKIEERKNKDFKYKPKLSLLDIIIFFLQSNNIKKVIIRSSKQL